MDFIVGLPNTSQRHLYLGNRWSINQNCPFSSSAYYLQRQKVCWNLFRSNRSSPWSVYDDHFWSWSTIHRSVLRATSICSWN
jgi:hypothetical protein